VSAAAALAALLGCAAFAGTAFGQVQSDFSIAAGREIYQVARFDPPRFALALGSDDSVFAFYGEAGNPLQGVKCERTAGFGFIALANSAGAILVGVCTREAQRVRALAVAAQPALETLVARLSLDPSALQKIDWTYVKNTGIDGAEEHFFPVLAIGHGILGPQTLVRVPRGARRAIVVQADTMHLCENFGLKTETPLCIDTRQALADIARRLEARFPD
jgi:hypothetical protein